MSGRTYSDLFLAAKKLLRAKPNLTDDELADELGVHKVDARGLDTIRQARKDTQAGQA